ncbi:MAG: GNAT family N-acetyltransferase [Candidatus Accumulibacter sp.]|nr:GNAT family N-acetyltransferase [Accumulibacter sp.]
MDQELLERTAPAKSNAGFRVTLARGTHEVRATQRLRYHVFGTEIEARPQGRIPGHDCDLYDPYCQHLVAREAASEELVGSLRILSPGAAERVGSYHAENIFDIGRLRKLRPRMAEVGRVCIHPDFRGSDAPALLWRGLVDHLLSRDHQILMSCVPIGIADGGRHAANVFQQIHAQQMAPIDYRVFPLHRLPVGHLADHRHTVMPRLIEDYLRVGAWVCGEPAWNPDFNTADLMLILPMARLARRR